MKRANLTESTDKPARPAVSDSTVINEGDVTSASTATKDRDAISESTDSPVRTDVSESTIKLAWRSRIVDRGDARARDLIPNPQNWRTHPKAQQAAMSGALEEVGWVQSIIVNRRSGHIVDGHLRAELAAARDETVPVVWVDLDDDEERKILATLDPIGGMAGRNDELFASLTANLSFASADLAALIAPPAESAYGGSVVSLSDRFVVPPFSVLDARQGYWQERKREWLALGLASHQGRGESGRLTFATGAERNDEVSARIVGMGAKQWNQTASLAGGLAYGMTMHAYDGTDPQTAASGAGTSIFDPVLCELAYRWFAPAAGRILDPFAGGSVRGIVAAALGREYTGVDLSPHQIEANCAQWAMIGPTLATVAPPEPRAILEPSALTPIDQRGELWFKRDDLFHIGAGNGGKARAMLTLAEGAVGLIACGARESTQISRGAQVAKALGIPCRVHTAAGEETTEMAAARAAGAEVVEHKPGYLSVVKARAREDAAASGWTEIPWGLEDESALPPTSAQWRDIPADVRRVVVPVGGGMTLAALLHAMDETGDHRPVLGVLIGGSVEDRLDRFAPVNWRDRVTLVESGLKYEQAAPTTNYLDVELDPIYEAKCLRFMEPGDMLWIVGIRSSAQSVARQVVAPTWRIGDSRDVLPQLEPGFDMIMSCPPYADLEVYSDDPGDLSNMDYEDFERAYREIIAGAVRLLADDRFAVFVVGDVRDRRGNYRDFPGATIRAFEDAGMHLYNEAILVTATGSLSIRAGRQFDASRKLGKTHQNVYVFLKGDAKRAVAALGHVDVTMPEIGESRADA